eukprot:s1133_g1.t1
MATAKKVKGKAVKKKQKGETGESVQADGQGGQAPSGSSTTEKTQTGNSETSPKKARKKLKKKATGKATKGSTKVATENLGPVVESRSACISASDEVGPPQGNPAKQDMDGCDLCEGLIPLEGVQRCRSCGRTMAATA